MNLVKRGAAMLRNAYKLANLALCLVDIRTNNKSGFSWVWRGVGVVGAGWWWLGDGKKENKVLKLIF